MGGWTKLLKYVIPTNVFGLIHLLASAASSLFFLSVSALFSFAASQYRFIFAASRSLVLASSRSRSQPDKILCKPRESGADLQRATLTAPWLCPVKYTHIFVELNALKLSEQNAQIR